MPVGRLTGVSIAMTVYLLSDVTLLLRNLTFAVATHVGNQSLPLCGALAHSALMGGVFSHHHIVNERKRCEKIWRLLGFASSLEREVRAINSGHALRDASQPFTCNFVSQSYWKNESTKVQNPRRNSYAVNSSYGAIIYAHT